MYKYFYILKYKKYYVTKYGHILNPIKKVNT